MLASSALTLVVALGASTPGLVHEQVAAELTRAGFGDARYQVEELASDRIVLRDVALPPDLTADRVRIDFDPGTVARDGSIARVTIEGATWTTSLDDESLRASAFARLFAASSSETGPARSPVERVSILRSRAVIRGHSIAIEGDVDPAAPRASLVVGSALGAHEVTVRVREDHGLSIEARPREGVGALAIDADPGLETLRFRVDTRAPRGWLAHAPLELDGDPGVAATGVARRTETGWSIEELAATLDVAGASIDGLALERVRAMAHGRAELGASIAIELDHAEIQAARVATEDVGAREVELEGPVAIQIDEDGARVVARAPLALRSRVLWVGSASSQIRAERVSLTLDPQDDAIATIRDSHVHLASAVRGGAARLRGVLRTPALRASGRLAFDVSPDQVRVEGTARGDTDALANLDSEIGLVRPHLEVDILTDARGNVYATGRGHAPHTTWRSVPVGPTEARIRISEPEMQIDAIGRATHDAPFAIGARIGLARHGGSVHIGVPMSEVRDDDALHRVLVALLDVHVRGRVGGQVDADLRTLGAGTARLALEGATLDPTSGRGGARGVHGVFTLSNLRPATSLTYEPVRYAELNVCDVVTTGPGTARLRFAADGKMEVEAMSAELGGGRVALAPFRIDLDEPDTTLDVTLENVELSEVATALSRGRLEATGRLDGRVGLSFRLGETIRFVLGEGHLDARPPGRIRVIGAPRSPAESRDPERLARTLGRRVVAALSDFEYSRLSIDLSRENGATRARARVAGRGASTPQEVELALNVHGLQPLIDEVLRLWPTTTTPRTGTTP